MRVLSEVLNGRNLKVCNYRYLFYIYLYERSSDMKSSFHMSTLQLSRDLKTVIKKL